MVQLRASSGAEELCSMRKALGAFAAYGADQSKVSKGCVVTACIFVVALGTDVRAFISPHSTCALVFGTLCRPGMLDRDQNAVAKLCKQPARPLQTATE